MIKPNDSLPVGSYVELKDGIDPDFYAGYSRVGHKGWIRRQRKDKYGYPQVYVEWDPHDWAYNGQPDCWTWSEHFTLLKPPEEDMTVEKDPKRDEREAPKDRNKAVTEITESFVKSLFGVLGVEDPAEEQVKGDSDENETPDWQETVMSAATAIDESEAFIVISLGRDPQTGQLYPMVFQNYKEEEFALVCQSHLAHLTMMCHDNLIHDQLHEVQQEHPEES